MNQKRKDFMDKYKNKGKKHVTYVLPEVVGDTGDIARKGYFIGLDGKSKTYEQLTEEEKQDWIESQARGLEQWASKRAKEDIER